MAKSAIAKLFKNGRSQAVRLPKEFRMAGDEVRVRKVGQSVILEPLKFDAKSWFTSMDAFGPGFMTAEEREQPPMPRERKVFK